MCISYPFLFLSIIYKCTSEFLTTKFTTFKYIFAYTKLIKNRKKNCFISFYYITISYIVHNTYYT